MMNFHNNLKSRGKGAKDWINSFTEVEYLGDNKFGASITGNRVFKDKTDNKWKKHKLTDDRPTKDYVLVQSAKCCVEVYPYYAKYYDVNHEEVRLYEERWVVQRLFKEPDEWRDVDAYNPVITVEEYSEPAGDVVKVTVTYDSDYGVMIVEYFQRDGNALKHNVTFKNTSGSEETFRVLQRWAGIVGGKCNDKNIPAVFSPPTDYYLVFHSTDKPSKKFTIAENLYEMVYDPAGQLDEDGNWAPKIREDQCLKGPFWVESHAQGMKVDLIYGNWVLGQNESLTIDPATATLDNPTEDGSLDRGSTTSPGCPAGALTRNTAEAILSSGGYSTQPPSRSEAWRVYIEWPIGAIPGGSTITDTVFKYHGVGNYSGGEINPITEEDPSGATDTNLWGYILSGTAYVDPFTVEVGTGKEIDLGASADSDLQDAVDAAQSWFAIGLYNDTSECPALPADGPPKDWRSKIYSENKTDAANPKPTLYVEYTPPSVPAVAKKPALQFGVGIRDRKTHPRVLKNREGWIRT